MITNPIRDPVLRYWLCQGLDLKDIGLKAVSTTGSGPVSEANFDKFLHRNGIQPRIITRATKVLIVGQEGWNEPELRNLIRARSGLRLRVYSQDMFFWFLVTGIDPLTSSRDVIERFGDGHPALTFLSGIVGFDWPTTVVHGGGNSELTKGWLERGFLKSSGYKVGHFGKAKEERHAALRKVYTAPLANDFSRNYRNEWGRPRSSVRLRKMANVIATLCRHAKRRPHDMKTAIRNWETDLQWLRAKYYDGHYQYQWPWPKIW